MTKLSESAVHESVLAAPVSLAGRFLGALVGPVPRFELVRAGRRGWPHLLRVVYLVCLLLFLWVSYRIGHVAQLHRVTPASVARFSELFLFTFLCVQFIAILLLTPAWLGVVVAEEKDRRRLEFLLTSRLSNCDIVLGKLVAGLARITLLILAGLPVLAVMQLLGGIDTNLVLAGYAATGIGMLSVGALSVLCSVHARKPHEAALVTYLAMIAFAVVSLLCRFVMRDSVLGLRWLAWIADGNILVVLYQLRRDWHSATPDSQSMPRLLLHFSVFHAAAALTCAAIAVLRLRQVAFPHLRPASPSWPARVRRWLLRPVLARWPMLWREIAEPRLRLGRMGRLCVVLIVLASLVPVAWPYLRSMKSEYPDWYQLRLQAETRAGLDIWGRLMVTGGAGLALLGVAMHAAGAVSRERERHTLDSLLTTPLTAREILFAKWLGSILSVRHFGVILIAVWLFAVGFSPASCLTLLAGLVAWLVYAGCGAMLGLWFSVKLGSIPKATSWTLAVLCGLGFGHWLPLLLVRPPAHAHWPYTVASFGMTPPAALHWLALNGDALTPIPQASSWWTKWEGMPQSVPHGSSAAFSRFTSGEYSLRPLRTSASPDDRQQVVFGIAAGIPIWLALTAVLWFLTVRRLARARPDDRVIAIPCPRVANR